MANQEEILDALCSYEKKPSKEIPPVLEDFLRQVAKTGETIVNFSCNSFMDGELRPDKQSFPWARLKPLFIRKLDQVMEQFNSEVPFDHLTPFPNVENVKYAEMRSRVVEAFEKFTGPPFTVQRICELVTEPRKHYQRSDKFLRGVEKNVMVVSTVDPYGKKISAEPPRNLMNGLDMNGFSKPRDDGDGPGDSPPFPTLSPTTWSDTGSVATIWPSVFPEQTVSHQYVSGNAVSEPKENIETEVQSSEMGSKTETAQSEESLHKLLGHKTDTAEMVCDQNEPAQELSKTENLEAIVETVRSETDSNQAENMEAKLDNLPNETSQTKEDGESSEKSDILDEKQSESAHIPQLNSETDKSEVDSVGKLEKDSCGMETNLPVEGNSSADSEMKTTDIGQEPVSETEESQVEKQEVVEDIVQQESTSPNMVSEVTAQTPETTTQTDIPPVPEASETPQVEHTEENSNTNQPEQSSPVICEEDKTEIQSSHQSIEETSNETAQSEISQSETVKVDQSTSEVTQTEAIVDQTEAAVQNEAVAQLEGEALKEAPENEAEAQSEAKIQNETEANQNEASVESEAVAVREETETEAMDASTEENVVGSTEAVPVKETEEITSSEGMDVDPAKSDGENSEVVSTSDQGTEEPMEH